MKTKRETKMTRVIAFLVAGAGWPLPLRRSDMSADCAGVESNLLLRFKELANAQK